MKMAESEKANCPSWLTVDNVAVGDTAVGVVAAGRWTAIAMVAVAWLNALGLVTISPLNSVGFIAIGGVNAVGVVAIGGVNSVGVISIGGLSSDGDDCDRRVERKERVSAYVGGDSPPSKPSPVEGEG